MRKFEYRKHQWRSPDVDYIRDPLFNAMLIPPSVADYGCVSSPLPPPREMYDTWHLIGDEVVSERTKKETNSSSNRTVVM